MTIRQYLTPKSIDYLRLTIGQSLILLCSPIDFSFATMVPEAFNIYLQLNEDTCLCIQNKNLFNSPNTYTNYYDIETNPIKVDISKKHLLSEVSFPSLAIGRPKISSIDIYEERILYSEVPKAELTIPDAEVDDVYYDKALVINLLDQRRLMLCLVDNISGMFEIHFDQSKMIDRLAEFHYRMTIQSDS